jgi:hypothetical protein
VAGYEDGLSAILICPTLLADVDFEGLTHCLDDLAAFAATSPPKDECAPFVGVGHDLSPFGGCHYLSLWTDLTNGTSICSCLGERLLTLSLLRKASGKLSW